MLVLRIIRFFTGYVVFTAINGFPERFINLCAANKIPLWDIQNRNSVITASTSARAYKLLREPAKKSGMKLHMEEKHGLIFFLLRHKKRYIFLFGAVFIIIFISIMSNMIWVVDVEDNDCFDSETVSNVFEELGLKPGVFKKNLDVSEIESKAAVKLQSAGWVNINIKGSTATVELRKKTAAPGIENKSGCKDIVAAKDGQLVLLEHFKGTQRIKVGSSVLKGDILISGIHENKDLSISFVHASGYAVALTDSTYSYSSQGKKDGVYLANTKRTYSIYFFGITVDLGKKPEGKNVFSCKKYMMAGGKKMPFGIFYTQKNYYKPRGISRNKQQNILYCADKAIGKAVINSKNTQIINKRIKVTADSSYAKVTENINGYENIGEEKDLVFENIQDDSSDLSNSNENTNNKSSDSNEDIND